MPASKEEWFGNKELFLMVQDLKEQIKKLCIQMEHTTTLIRDYNGLRERVNNLEVRLSENQGKEKGSLHIWGYIVGGVGIITAIAGVVFQLAH